MREAESLRATVEVLMGVLSQHGIDIDLSTNPCHEDNSLLAAGGPKARSEVSPNSTSIATPSSAALSSPENFQLFTSPPSSGNPYDDVSGQVHLVVDNQWLGSLNGDILQPEPLKEIVSANALNVQKQSGTRVGDFDSVAIGMEFVLE